MTQRLPPLAWLRAFEVSARHLNFTHAASELNLTQAAISKQVKLLEHFLREPLFHRKPRSLVLTKVGHAYLPKVRDAFERLSEGTQEVFGNRRSEILTVRVASAFSVNWISPRLGRFFDLHPKIGVRLISSVWNDDADKERYDLDIRYGNGRWPGFRADRLSWERLEPVCAPHLVPEFSRPDDLVKTRLLHVIGYEQGWAHWLKTAGATKVDAGQGLQVDTSLLAFSLAAQGLGVALGRSSILGPELRSGRLQRPFELSVPVDEAFYMVSPSEAAEHPHTAAFREWILQEAHAGRPEG